MTTAFLHYSDVGNFLKMNFFAHKNINHSNWVSEFSFRRLSFARNSYRNSIGLYDTLTTMYDMNIFITNQFKFQKFKYSKRKLIVNHPMSHDENIRR